MRSVEKDGKSMCSVEGGMEKGDKSMWKDIFEGMEG